MGMVMIRCPETGDSIPTGITTDREKFQCSAVFFARTYCRICSVTHEWFARDAWVYDAALAKGDAGRWRSSPASAA